MTDAEKVAYCHYWFTVGVCPRCGTPLHDIDASGDGHFPGGRAFTSGHGKVSGRCSLSSDDLYSICLIGSGTVGYHPDTDVSNRAPAGDDGSPREIAPTRLLR